MTERVVLLTDLGEGKALDASRELESLAWALEQVAFPYQEQPKDPVEVVIYARAEDFRALVQQWTSGEFRAGQSYTTGTAGQIVLSGEFVGSSRSTFVHELTHRYVNFHYPGAPTWLNEGLAQYMESLHVSDTQVVFGLKRGVSGDHRPSTAVLALKPREFYLRPQLDETSTLERNSNYGSAWKAVHAMADLESPLRPAYLDYLSRLARIEPARAAFSAAFSAWPEERLRQEIDEHHLRMMKEVRTELALPKISPAVEVLSEEEGRGVWLFGMVDARREIDRRAAMAELMSRTSSAAHPSLSLLELRAAVEARKRLEAARPTLERIRALDPTDSDALTMLVDAYRVLRKKDSSLEPVLQGLVERLARKGKTAMGYAAVGWVDLEAGRIERAATFAKRATDREPGCGPCWQLRAKAYEAQHHLLKARQAVEIAYALAGNDEVETELEAEMARLEAAVAAEKP
ncbi:MAG: hypothetical protein U1E65_26470 [Myxococcota bacterium]